MKIKNIALTLLAASSIFTTGCNKVDQFLNADPSKNSKRPIETLEQLDAVLASYCFYPVSYFEEKPDMAWASDDYYIEADLHTLMTRGYNNFVYQYGLWDSTNANGKSYCTWNTEYKKLFYCNMVLDYADKVPGDEAHRANIKADAHLMRAICYFQIALAHTLYYDGKNGDELGITLKKSSSFEEDMSRATLKETWDAIDNEIKEALKITAPFQKAGQPNRNWRGSTAGANAYAARYYLYRADYENAEKHAKAVLNEYNVLKDFNDPKEMSYHTIESKYVVDAGTPQEREGVFHYSYLYYNQLVTYFEMEPNFEVFLGWKELLYARACQDPTSWLIPSPSLIQTFATDVPEGKLDNDLRYHFFVLPEYGVNGCKEKTSRTAQYPRYATFMGDMISGPTTAEMYLIVAECEARKGQTSEAMKYLNTLRKNRINKSVYVDLTASSQSDAVKKILQERRREMPFAMRWYDLKRLNATDPENQVTLKKTFFPYTSTNVLVGEPTKEYVLEPNSRHYAIPLDQNEINNAEGVLEQNRY